MNALTFNLSDPTRGNRRRPWPRRTIALSALLLCSALALLTVVISESAAATDKTAFADAFSQREVHIVIGRGGTRDADTQPIVSVAVPCALTPWEAESWKRINLYFNFGKPTAVMRRFGNPNSVF